MYIFFDIGGTNLRAASSIDGKTFVQNASGNFQSVSTPQSYSEGLEAMLNLAKQLSNGQAITKVVVGLPGLLNEEKTSLVHSWNLEEWSNKPIAEDLAKGLYTEIVLENDAALGALGEANFGAGKGHRRVMFVTVGTGYGGAWVIDGKLVAGKFGFEPGHQIIDFTDSAKLMNSIELEDLVSGSSITAEQRNILWETIATPFSTGIYNTFLHWPSDIIVLGGGVILNSDMPLEGLKEKLDYLLGFFATQPELKRSELGEQAAFFGALSLL